MLSKPKYNYGDIVRFKNNGEIKFGKIEIIDSNGTYFQKEEPSYDIMVNDEQCLYKHIRESFIEDRYHYGNDTI